MRGLLAATAFLTRLPVGRGWIFSAEEVGRAARWYPAIGALLGGLAIAARMLLAPFFPAALLAVLLVGLDALLTGALHLDGVADTADGFGGGMKPEDRMRIMRDHAIGAYGAVALVLVIALKIAATASVVESPRAVAALLLSPTLGRWSVVALSATQPYARPAGEASRSSPARHIGRVEIAIASILTVAATLAADPRRGSAALALVVFATVVWGWHCRRMIGGITGDTLGTGLEIAECLVLLLFSMR
jgi:cobalamin 5'-phosphate synthase/cobalamin synthase